MGSVCRTMSRVYRLLVGAVLLALMTAIRSFVWYKYVPGAADVWPQLLIILMLLPADGVTAELYGFWSGEKLIAAAAGVFPSIIGLAVASMGHSFSPRALTINLLLGLWMGAMGLGGAEYREDRKPLWLVTGFCLWLFTLLLAIGSAD